MNYPIETLNIIAPILFIVMLIGFPIIGVFGGWKRAAFWGGGNFLFYIIGLLIIRFGGVGIANSLQGLIKTLLPKNLIAEADILNISRSLIAPVIFIITLFLGNIILVINYYAWFKRIAGLKKYKKVKKEDKKGKITKVKIQVQHKQSTKYKVINMVVGGVGMGALMLPTTIGFTQATYYLTTSTSTRAASKFSDGLYQGLEKMNRQINWFSYYEDGKSGCDFDAIWSGLKIFNQEITITYINGSGQEVTVTDTATEVIKDVVSEGIPVIIEEIKKYDGKAPEKIINALNNFTKSWNQIVDQLGNDIYGLFSSVNLIETVGNMIKGDLTGFSLNDEDMKNFAEAGNIYDILVAGYESGKVVIGDKEYEIVKAKSIQASAEAVNKIEDVLKSMIDSSEIKEPENIKKYNKMISDMARLFVVPK